MSLRRFLLSCSAVLLALSVVVRDADALDTVQPTYLSKQTCGFDVCQNQGPIQWGDWNYGEAFRYQFFEGLQLTLSV